ncbi:radical SAM protein [Candidatus Bathyarchaeota archaeon]|nr:radical SAM protein [Candidatus Bathyarchaeota archaeon]
MRNSRFPEKVRVSIGSAVVLGLMRCRLDIKPTTAYLLMYRNEKCAANCGFCPQARDSKAKTELLSRVTWPVFQTKQVIEGIIGNVKDGTIKRVCIQSLNYSEVFTDILFFVKEIKSRVKVPISVSCKPLDQNKLKKWADAGVDRISIALDATTEKIFEKIKGAHVGGPYYWKKHKEALRKAVKVFGKDSVSTHLIVGLGETEKEIVELIQWCVDSGIYPAIFAFTPIPGTKLEKKAAPTLETYRRIQVVHYILTHRKARVDNMEFDKVGKIMNFGNSKEKLLELINTGMPFLTSGCKGCNRPYYNEKPGGPIYNYPRKLFPDEIEEVKKLMGF